MKVQTKEGFEALASRTPHWPETLELEVTPGLQKDSKAKFSVWGWLLTRAPDGTILMSTIALPDQDVSVEDNRRMARIKLEDKVSSYGK